MVVSFPTPAAILIRFAAVIFLHAAYSAWKERTAAKAAGLAIAQTYGIALPSNVIVQTLAASIILCLGVIWSATPLKASTWAAEMRGRSIDSEDSRLGFATVRHRGAVLFGPR